MKKGGRWRSYPPPAALRRFRTWEQPAVPDDFSEPGHIVIDGRPMRGLGWEHRAVVKADSRICCAARPSVVARKVCRDRLMERLYPRYPGYR